MKQRGGDGGVGRASSDCDLWWQLSGGGWQREKLRPDGFLEEREQEPNLSSSLEADKK